MVAQGPQRLCLSVVLVAFATPYVARWAIPRVLRWSFHPDAGTQTMWEPRHPPDLGGALVRGLPTHAWHSDRRMDFMEHNFTHAFGDVWVVAYQRAGATWAQHILTHIIGHPPATSVFDFFGLNGTCNWPEVDVGPFATSTEHLQESAAGGDEHRCLRSHWPRRDFLTQLPSSSKVIYVMREVESLALSYWSHVMKMYFYYGVQNGTVVWDDFFKKFLDGDVENGDYFEHVASWWQARDDPNVLILRYEDLKSDPAATVRKMSAFVGAPVDNARVGEIVDATNSTSMKQLLGGIDQFFWFVGAMRNDHVRKGVAGHMEQLITTSQRRSLADRFDKVLKPLGMPFEHMFDQFFVH